MEEEDERIKLNIRKSLIIEMNNNKITHKIITSLNDNIEKDCMLLKCRVNSELAHRQSARLFF